MARSKVVIASVIHIWYGLATELQEVWSVHLFHLRLMFIMLGVKYITCFGNTSLSYWILFPLMI